MTVSLALSNIGPASRGLVELAHADPGRALATVGRIDLDTLEATEAASVCWAAGLAHRELGDLDAAERFLQRAISVAEDPELAALITSSLALVHLARGDLTQALGMVESAARHISGMAWARNEMQRGLVLQRQGDLVGALEAYRRAEPDLGEDPNTLVRLLNNRALAASYQGDHEGGAADLARAYHLAVTAGQHLSSASCAANLGFTLGRLGDVASALDWFARAEAVFDQLGVADTRRAVLALDRAEVAAHAGLLAEARRDAAEASRVLAEAGSLVDAAEADLLAARLALAANDHEAAARLAGTAQRLFEAQGRDSWSVQARFVEVTARSELGLSGAEESLALIGDLERLGWQLEAAQARVAAAAALIRQGKMSRARRLLAEHDAGRSEPAVLRAQRWHARSLLAVSDGDVGAARRALRSGLAVLDEHRSVLGSPELRAHASTIGRDLIVRAVQLAVDSGRPWSLLATVESWRAASLHLPPAHRPEDTTLAADLTALRQLDGEIRATSGDDVAALLTRRARLEDRVRRASHGVRGVAETKDRIERGRVVEALAGRTLVAFLRDRGRLRAVSVRDGAVRSHDLADADSVADEVRSLVFSLHRMASGSGSPGARQATAAAFSHASETLHHQVLAPIESLGSGLVVVPTGVLHRLPWHAVARGEVVTVAPSVGSWLRSTDRWEPLASDGRVVLAAGPELPGARSEVEALARRYPNRVRLTGRSATAAAVLEGLEDASLAHLAAHGTFRSDNPLFSSLQFHDGRVTVYDLERVRRAPTVVVMPSCDTAVSEVIEGDEILGLSAALLGLGVAALVAPVVPVPDRATRPLMLDLHRHLAAGLTPSAALAAAVNAAPDAEPEQQAVRSAFVALGV